jgi:hypothetical protein
MLNLFCFLPGRAQISTPSMTRALRRPGSRILKARNYCFKSAGAREIEFARIIKASLQYNCGRRTKSPQTHAGNSATGAGNSQPAWPFYGCVPVRRTRHPTARPTRGKGTKKSAGVGSGFEPGTLWIRTGNPGGTGTEIRGGGGGSRAGRHPPPSCLRRGECRRGGVGRIAGPYGVSHTGNLNVRSRWQPVSRRCLHATSVALTINKGAHFMLLCLSWC